MARIFKAAQTIKRKGRRIGYAPTKNYYLEFKDWTGKRRRETAGPDKKAAELLLAQRLQHSALAAAGHHIDPEIGLYKLINLYMDYIKGRRAQNTYNSKASALAKLRTFFSQDPRPSHITTKLMGDYVMGLVENGLCHDSANIHIAHIRAMLEWGYASGTLSIRSPAAAIENLPADEKKIRPRRALTLDECSRLLDAATGSMETVILLGLYSGLRISEIQGLQWKDIDVTNQVMTIPATISKGKTDKTLPIQTALASHLAMRKLAERPDETDTIIKISKNPYRDLKRLLKKADIKRVNERGVVDFHAFRHTFLTMAAASGAEPKTLQTLARHTSPVTTLKIYVHPDIDRMKSALESLPKFGRKAANA